ncbi:inosine-uridine nucleoside N-ribohydrolase [Chitinophaga terrae (ex Kim and Jung 2007)]|uniref:nucleoside hydrolase n=1 Tax=Chitinophaga terrae (ex Kim and Jung 2007) TaxID=408074 RepID=UPI0027860E0C|nr:nucleoside hydrolase [Chitinophaga terrae (ex Kim and Jung 2007)]MDQ0109779.1 inosine-uridine nucleoside N-ribohydrolase [Chitinophaga terrae (ex Kim and Jung 2007)]
MRFTYTILAGLLFCCNIQGFGQSRAPKAVIFDTDMGPDYDDVGAIAVLHALANDNKARILATVASNKYPGIASVLNVFNTYFKRPDIPIGVPKGEAVSEADWQHWSDTLLARYPHRIKSNDEVPDAVALYRKILAKQPDKSVTIITVGFFTNLSNLLQSGPDAYSKLSGKELVEKKVKQLVSMAGAFPKGREFNVMRDSTASLNVFSYWPGEIVFSGFEIGEKIKTGLPLIHNQQINHSPVKDAFAIAIPKAAEDAQGRMSWDQTAVLVGVMGAAPYFDVQPGRIIGLPNGDNDWDNSGSGHYYLKVKMPVPEVTALINDLMQRGPKQK